MANKTTNKATNKTNSVSVASNSTNSNSINSNSVNSNSIAPNTSEQQIAEKIVKKKRISPPRKEQQPILEPGDNTAFLTHTMKMWDWITPSMRDNNAVRQRILDYLTICQEDDMKPSVAGLAMAFGVERKTLWRWVNGVQGDVSEECRLTLKKAYQVLNAQMEQWMQTGKINPVSGIFLMKNNMGYTDKTEVVLTPNTEDAEKAPEQLQNDYLQAIGYEEAKETE